MGETSVDNLLEAIKSSKTQTFARLITGLGIPHLGSENAGLVADHYRTLEGLTAASLVANIWRNMPDEDRGKSKQIRSLTDIDGIGPTIAESIRDWLQLGSNLKILRDLKSRGVKPPAVAQPDENDQRFVGLRFVVTGRLDSLSRQEAQVRIKELGGAVSSSVSKRTDYVVVGKDPGSKYESAIRLEVSVLEEAEFLAFLDSGDTNLS